MGNSISSKESIQLRPEYQVVSSDNISNNNELGQVQSGASEQDEHLLESLCDLIENVGVDLHTTLLDRLTDTKHKKINIDKPTEFVAQNKLKNVIRPDVVHTINESKCNSGLQVSKLISDFEAKLAPKFSFSYGKKDENGDIVVCNTLLPHIHKDSSNIDDPLYNDTTSIGAPPCSPDAVGKDYVSIYPTTSKLDKFYLWCRDQSQSMPIDIKQQIVFYLNSVANPTTESQEPRPLLPSEESLLELEKLELVLDNSNSPQYTKGGEDAWTIEMKLQGGLKQREDRLITYECLPSPFSTKQFLCTQPTYLTES